MTEYIITCFRLRDKLWRRLSLTSKQRARNQFSVDLSTQHSQESKKGITST